MEAKATLNPYASSYIPLSREEKLDTFKSFKTGSPEKSGFGDKTAFAKPSSSGSVDDKNSSLTGITESACNVNKPLNVEDRTSSNTQSYEQNPQEELDVEYLASIFSDFSFESLADVYYANGGDLDASISMLQELESPADFSHPPETNFRSPPEYETSSDQATAAAISGETSGSTIVAAEPANEG
ncbi:hypothetical protein Syun_011257 [Stephania yunnanensis]|uniref:CUE domain-containing protein n=1 Tax=Stephania yunnanensis TaxID=152371 RepID=A0AAP0JZL1_9MAGN